MKLLLIGNWVATAGFLVPLFIIAVCVIALMRVRKLQQAPLHTAWFLNSEVMLSSYNDYLKLQVAEYSNSYLKGRNLPPQIRHLGINSNSIFEHFMAQLETAFDTVHRDQSICFLQEDGQAGNITVKCKLENKAVWLALEVVSYPYKQYMPESVSKDYIYMNGNEPRFLVVHNATLLFGPEHDVKVKMVVAAVSATYRAVRKKPKAGKIMREAVPMYTLTRTREGYHPKPRTSDMTKIMRGHKVLNNAYNEISFEIGEHNVEVPMNTAIEYVVASLKRGINIAGVGSANTCKSSFASLVAEQLAEDRVRVCQIPVLNYDNTEAICDAVIDLVEDGVFTVFTVDDCSNVLRKEPMNVDPSRIASVHASLKNILDSGMKTMGDYAFLLCANEAPGGFQPEIFRKGRLSIQIKFTELNVERAHNLAVAIHETLQNDPKDVRFFDFSSWQRKKYVLEASNGTIPAGEIFNLIMDPVQLTPLQHLETIKDFMVNNAAAGNQYSNVEERLKQEETKLQQSAALQVEMPEEDKPTDQPTEEPAPTLKEAQGEDFDREVPEENNDDIFNLDDLKDIELN